MPWSGTPGRLAIIGASGNALDVLDIIAALNKVLSQGWRVAGVLDDAAGPDFMGVPVLGGLASVPRLARPGGVLDGAQFVLAIGSDRTHSARESILVRAGLDQAAFATLVHPSAGVSSLAMLSLGCCVGFAASIAGRARLGAHAWVGPGAVIGHDSVLEPFAMMAPRATISGGVRVGRGAYIGSGAVVRQGITIGAGALVGLGAVVVKDVPPDAVVVGNPARPYQCMEAGALATRG
jgi:sugar O-acyltransferase (sialic acid O-acetyltransferase NeuD family)